MTEEANAGKKLSRRQFVGAAAGGAAALGAGAILIPKLTSAAAAKPAGTGPATTGQALRASVPARADPAPIPSSWNKAADVIVCGSGAAGLPAALAAAEAGASVMLVESANQLGGCATISGGTVGIGGGNALQIAKGIVENAGTIYQDFTQHIIYYSNVETKTLSTTTPVRMDPGEKGERRLIRAFADRSLDTWNWLVAHGVKFSGVSAVTGSNAFFGTRATSTTVPDVVDPTGLGATSPKSIAGGAGWCNPLIAALKKLSNVDVELKTRMSTIIREGPLSGRVLGIAAEVGGQTVYLRANRAVIVATGGWKGNPWLRSRFDPRPPATLTYSGTPFCYDDGTGLLAALNVGASLTSDRNQDIHGWHRHWGALYHQFPLGSPYGVPGIAPTTPADYIFVNGSGTRFIDENTPETGGWFFGDPPYSFYDVAFDQQLLGPYGTPGVWTIMDSAAMTRENINPATWLGPPPVVDANLVFSASTVNQLAAAISVDPTALTTTINNYNSYVTAGADPDFGKPASLLKNQINTPPYYAVWTNIVIHDTCGGAAINENCQVLDINGNAIPNLYAGGETAGGLDFLGVAKGIVQGRIAGENAAIDQSW